MAARQSAEAKCLRRPLCHFQYESDKIIIYIPQKLLLSAEHKASPLVPIPI